MGGKNPLTCRSKGCFKKMIIKLQIFAMLWGTYGYQLIPRIEECGLTCSQGFLCKTQISTGILNSFCHPAPASPSHVILRSMKLWTAMKCTDGHQCSLHLSIKGTLHLQENVRGMEICSLSVSTQKSQCVNMKVSRNTHVKFTGKKVKLQFNCFEVSAGQHVYVTMRTIPNYCGVQLSQEYYVEDCRNSDVGKHIPSCFAGKLAYEVDRAKHTILLNISNVAQSVDYYVRLCHQWFVCEDVGLVSLIQRNDLVKSISLPFTQLLPCLCIEAWPAIPDARRMQMCPFKNNTKALWDDIIYNAVTQTLTWEAACPIHVNVSLCRLMKTSDQCVDLTNSSKTAPEKVKYSRVDAHPRLCMKGGLMSTYVNISGRTCGLNICVQGWRTDVDYSIPTYVCGLPCVFSSRSQQHYETSFNILSAVAMVAVLVIMTALLGHLFLPVLYRKRKERKGATHIKTQRKKSIHSLHC